MKHRITQDVMSQKLIFNMRYEDLGYFIKFNYIYIYIYI